MMKAAAIDHRPYWDTAMSYNAYRDLIDEKLAKGESTTEGGDEALVPYSELNVVRMKRLDKTTKVSATLLESINKAEFKPKVLIISEGWCGDAAQIVPVMEVIAAQAGLDTKIILRDSYPEFMDEHMINGTRSIPVIVFLHPDTFEPITEWGPRPAPAQKMLMDWKAESEPRSDVGELKKNMQLWYARDKQQTMQAEWEALFQGF